MKQRVILISLHVVLIFSFSLLVGTHTSFAKSRRIGERLCKKDKNYLCVKVKKGDKWASLWPDKEQRDIIMRLNRLNLRLRKGMTLAVPLEFKKDMMRKISPFPKNIGSSEEKIIMIDLTQLAWGAYDKKGNLVRWGPASGGKNWCPDVKRRCRTPAKVYAMKRKVGRRCRSRKYPIPKGGARMPYCMFFHGGYAMHGSSQVPGYNASHGCVRMFVDDAKWLNETFIDLPDKKNELPGTKVIILPYSNKRT